MARLVDVGAVLHRPRGIHPRNTRAGLPVANAETHRLLDFRQQHAIHPLGGAANHPYAPPGEEQRVFRRTRVALRLWRILGLALAGGPVGAAVRGSELGPLHHHDYDIRM